MAAPRPKKTTVKKKPPVKKKPSFLKKDTPRPARDIKPGDLRSQTLANDNTPRPAKDLNKGGLRAKFLKDASQSAASRTLSTVLRTGLRVAGPVGALASMTVPAGTGSTVPGQAQKAVEKKMKREIRQGPKLAVTGVKEGTTRRLAPTGSRKPAPGANYSGQEKKIPRKPAPGANYSGPAKSTYSGYGDFKTPKVQSSSSNTAATTAASSGSSGGSQAANVAKAGGKAKAKVGRQTRYQRNELAMEQRKRSSGKPKKSIFSLFRKG